MRMVFRGSRAAAPGPAAPAAGDMPVQPGD